MIYFHVINPYHSIYQTFFEKRHELGKLSSSVKTVPGHF